MNQTNKIIAEIVEKMTKHLLWRDNETKMLEARLTDLLIQHHQETVEEMVKKIRNHREKVNIFNTYTGDRFAEEVISLIKETLE